MSLIPMKHEDIPLKIKGLDYVYSGVLQPNGTYSVVNDWVGNNPHKIFIIAYGTWNHSSLLAVFPNNGSTPVVRTIGSYPTAPDGFAITANDLWGFTIKNTFPSTVMPITIFSISKGD